MLKCNAIISSYTESKTRTTVIEISKKACEKEMEQYNEKFKHITQQEKDFHLTITQITELSKHFDTNKKTIKKLLTKIYDYKKNIKKKYENIVITSSTQI